MQCEGNLETGDESATCAVTMGKKQRTYKVRAVSLCTDQASAQESALPCCRLTSKASWALPERLASAWDRSWRRLSSASPAWDRGWRGRERGTKYHGQRQGVGSTMVPPPGPVLSTGNPHLIRLFCLVKTCQWPLVAFSMEALLGPVRSGPLESPDSC